MDTFINNMRCAIDKEAQNVVQLLYKYKIKLCTAESCTGGLLSGAVTEIAGSSGVFELGICAYANEIKMKMLGVSAETLEKYGAVSAECAAEMAQGARKASGADVSISITGIAGPDGGTPEKPVGTVFFACCYKDKCSALHVQINPEHGRKGIRLEAVKQALELIKKTIELKDEKGM